MAEWPKRDAILAGLIVVALIVGALALMAGVAFAIGFAIRYVADVLG